MNRKNIIVHIILLLLLITSLTSIASAATVKLVSPATLPAQLHEGEQVTFKIKIEDYSSENKQISIETNLVSSGNPLFDFGELNQYIQNNRYQQKITLDISSLPQKGFLYVTISGQAPEGETRTKYDNTDLVISKFTESKIKYFEIIIDNKLAGIETTELIINKKENFEKTMEGIRRKEFDNLKTDVRKLFSYGLVTEAQNIATEMSNFKWPDSLVLFGLIKIESETWLNIIVIILIAISFVAGYLLGSNPSQDDNIID